jgi:hypothetical protein
MEAMRWYNPLRMEEDEAIEILSGHQDSDRFIEEYRIRRAMQTDVVKALIFTGEMLYSEHRRGPPPASGSPRGCVTRSWSFRTGAMQDLVYLVYRFPRRRLSALRG